MSRRSWLIKVCPCGQMAGADTQCAGFPGAWNADRGDYDRAACLAEIVEVVEQEAEEGESE